MTITWNVPLSNIALVEASKSFESFVIFIVHGLIFYLLYGVLGIRILLAVYKIKYRPNAS